MVDVGVGNQNLFEFQAQFGEAAVNSVDLVAGIDDDGLMGFFVAQQSAVACEWPDGKGLKDHDSDCRTEPA